MFLGCNSVTNNFSLQDKKPQTMGLKNNYLSKSLYGINIDSMFVETKKSNGENLFLTFFLNLELIIKLFLMQ